MRFLHKLRSSYARRRDDSEGEVVKAGSESFVVDGVQFVPCYKTSSAPQQTSTRDNNNCNNINTKNPSMALSENETTSPSSDGRESYSGTRLSAYKRLTRSAIRRAERAAAGVPRASLSPKEWPVKSTTPVRTPTKRRTSVFIENTSDADDEKPAKKPSPERKAKESVAAQKQGFRSPLLKRESKIHHDLNLESYLSRSVPDSPEDVAIPFNQPVYPEALVSVHSRLKMHPRNERGVSAASTTTEQDLAIAIDDLALHGMTTSQHALDTLGDSAPLPSSSTVANAPTWSPFNHLTPTPPSNSKPLTLITENIDSTLTSSPSYIETTPTPKTNTSAVPFARSLSTTPVHPPLPPPPFLAHFISTSNTSSTALTHDPPSSVQVWTTHNMHSSRPVAAWGWSKRWTCCQCGAETITEQKMCSHLKCGHERCDLTCGLEWKDN